MARLKRAEEPQDRPVVELPEVLRRGVTVEDVLGDPWQAALPGSDISINGVCASHDDGLTGDRARVVAWSVMRRVAWEYRQATGEVLDVRPPPFRAEGAFVPVYRHRWRQALTAGHEHVCDGR